MGVTKRKYRTKDGVLKESKFWAYEYFIDAERYQGTIDESFALKSPGKELIPDGKKPESLTRKEADAICDKLKEHTKQSLYGEVKREITFDEIAIAFYKDYLAKLEKRRKAAAHKRIQDAYNSYIIRLQDHFGGMAISEIDKTHLAAYRTKRRHQGVKDKTIRNELLCLSSIYTHAVDEGTCEEDDVPHFKTVLKKLKRSKQRTRYLSEKEYDQLIASYDTRAKEISDKVSKHGRYRKSEEPENPYAVRTRKRMVMFDVETGLRREELLSALESDCDQDNNTIRVRETKNGQDRVVPLSKLATQLLHEQLHEKRLLNIESTYLFCKKNGTRFTEFRKGFKEDCVRAGVKDLTTHDLRRTFGSWRLQGIRCKAMRIEEVSKLLGHSDISITQKAYAFLEIEKIKLQ